MNPRAATRTHLSPNSWIDHCRHWLPNPDTTLLALASELPWQQEHLNMYGKSLAQPRLTAVCGVSMNPASRYRRPNPDAPWTATADRVRNLVKHEVANWEPNGLIANRYRNGADSISWHSDSEPAWAGTRWS